MYPFSTIKNLKRKIEDLESHIKALESPLRMPPLADWKNMTQDEVTQHMRLLDQILTLKKAGKWDYKNNCAKAT